MTSSAAPAPTKRKTSKATTTSKPAKNDHRKIKGKSKSYITTTETPKEKKCTV